MADIVRRDQGELIPSRRGRWDPFEAVRDMLAWDPFQTLERPFGFGLERGDRFVPAFDMKETKDSFVLRADLPGVKEDDIDLSLTGNRLTITGKREEERKEEGEQSYVFERSYGAFMRSFTLPEGCDVDHVDAELKDGVLTVLLPKKPEVQAKKISLKGLKSKVSDKLKA